MSQIVGLHVCGVHAVSSVRVTFMIIFMHLGSIKADVSIVACSKSTNRKLGLYLILSYLCIWGTCVSRDN